MEPDALTVEEAIALIDARAAKGPAKGKKKDAPQKKAPAKKKAAAKKGAAEKRTLQTTPSPRLGHDRITHRGDDHASPARSSGENLGGGVEMASMFRTSWSP